LNRKSPTPDFEESERTMTTSKRLAAFHAAQSGDDFAETDPTRPEDEEDESTANHKEGTKKKEKPMADEPVSAAEHASAIADATAKATEAANARFSAVLASEHYTGREALATNLLGNASMSAEAIIGALAASPKTETSSAPSQDDLAAAEERGAQKAMKSAQEGDKNSGLEDGEGNKPDARAEADSVWTKAYGLNEKGTK
jgi:hypothetical protein